MSSAFCTKIIDNNCSVVFIFITYLILSISGGNSMWIAAPSTNCCTATKVNVSHLLGQK